MEIVTVEKPLGILTEQEISQVVITEKSGIVTVVDKKEITVVAEITGNIVQEQQSTQLIVQGGIQGPPGPAGPTGPTGPAGDPAISEEDMTYSKRIDFISDSVLYKGEAAVGSSESSAAWRIRKVVIEQDGDVSETWAAGTAAFDKTWNLRASYVYS